MSFITFITDIQENEPDILKSVQYGELTLISASGVILRARAPEEGWTHDLLVNIYSAIKFVTPVDAKIDDMWVGSTEV